MKLFQVAAVTCALALASAPPANAVVGLVPPPPPPPAGPPGGGGGGGGSAGGWFVIGCAGLIVFAALKHAGQRQLTQKEAWSCGLLGLFDPVEKPAQKALRVKG